MIFRLLNWLGERTSLLQIFNQWLKSPVRGGGWRIATGSVVILLLFLLFVTGFILTFYYVPSTPHAHTSVLFIIKEVPGGALIRAIHHQAANGLVIVGLIYLGQLFYAAAYKHKQELIWISGLLLLGLTLAACFTGQLLPWDQKGYYGTRVGSGLIAGLPVVGSLLNRLFLGDSSISTLTLSRFFALHTLALPLAFILLLLFRATINRTNAEPVSEQNRETYYPTQFARDMTAVTVVFLLVVLISWVMGSPLETMADPSDTEYLAWPEWYFLPLNQLLRFLPTSIESIAGVVLVTLIALVLLAIPFIDRSEGNSWAARKLSIMIMVGIGTGLILLTIKGIMAERSADVQAKLINQRERAAELLRNPFRPIPVGRATAAPVQETSVTAVAEQSPTIKTYFGLCAPCHGSQGKGGPLGSSLIGISTKRNYSKDELVALIANPNSHGLTGEMPGFSQLSKSQRESLADLLLKLDSPEGLIDASKSRQQTASPVPTLYQQKCASCHGAQAEGGFGPKLIGINKRRSQADLVKLIAQPSSAGLKPIMPAFPNLSEAERNEIANWLLSLQ